MNRVVITQGVRTLIGRYIGSLWDVPAEKLGAVVLNELVMTFPQILHQGVG